MDEEMRPAGDDFASETERAEEWRKTAFAYEQCANHWREQATQRLNEATALERQLAAERRDAAACARHAAACADEARRLRALLARLRSADYGHEGYATGRLARVDGVLRAVPVDVPCGADCLACAVDAALAGDDGGAR